MISINLRTGDSQIFISRSLSIPMSKCLLHVHQAQMPKQFSRLKTEISTSIPPNKPKISLLLIVFSKLVITTMHHITQISNMTPFFFSPHKCNHDEVCHISLTSSPSVAIITAPALTQTLVISSRLHYLVKESLI